MIQDYSLAMSVTVPAHRVTVVSTNAPPLDQWSHICVVWSAVSSTGIAPYLNGEWESLASSSGTGSALGYKAANAGIVTVSNANGDDVLTGRLYDLRV